MKGGNFNKNWKRGFTRQSKLVRSGFTLIELLIVIVIVGILAAMAVSSFGSAQKHARLDVAVDSIISTIKEQQGKAQNGRQTGVSSNQQNVPGNSDQGQASCFGIVFQKTSSPSLQTVIAPYIAVNPDQPKADYCDPTSPKTVLTPLVVTDDIILIGLQQGDASIDSLVILFKPPFGKVIEMANLATDTAGKTEPTGLENPVKILLNQKNNSADQERAIQFDALSGLIQKVNVPLPATP